MLRKFFKIMMVLAAVGTILAVASWYTFRYINTQKAIKISNEILASIPSQQSTEDEWLKAITTRVFEIFEHGSSTAHILHKLSPYIANKRLPKFIRFPEGVIDTNLQLGKCDNVSRMLGFVLKQEGFSSTQFNMVTVKEGHSGLLVSLSNDRKVFLDPYFGFVAINKDGMLTDMEAAKTRIMTGEKIENVLRPLSEKSDISFYNNIDSVSMAPIGEDLIIKTKLPYIDDSELSLGTINGHERDVKGEARNLKTLPYWHYMGHRYDREWVRVLEVSQPVKFVMTLVQPAEEGVLVSTPSPKIDGKTLTWELDKGDSLVLQDGLAKISLKRLNSYINVDQITIHPLN